MKDNTITMALILNASKELNNIFECHCDILKENGRHGHCLKHKLVFLGEKQGALVSDLVNKVSK